jgi:hypothetical protein
LWKTYFHQQNRGVRAAETNRQAKAGTLWPFCDFRGGNGELTDKFEYFAQDSKDCLLTAVLR